MPRSDATRRILLNIGRLVWALLFLPCALVLIGFAFDTEKKTGPYDQYFALIPGLSAMLVSFMAPFLVLLRGKIAFKPVAITAAALALGASTLFSMKEHALVPYLPAQADGVSYALDNLPGYVVIFAIGAALCWALTALGRNVFKTPS